MDLPHKGPVLLFYASEQDVQTKCQIINNLTLNVLLSRLSRFN